MAKRWTLDSIERHRQTFETATIVWPVVLTMRRGEGRSWPAAWEIILARRTWRLRDRAGRGLLCSQDTILVTPVKLDGGRQRLREVERVGLDETANAIINSNECPSSTLDLGQNFLALPDEIILIMFSELPDQDLWAVAKVFPVTNEILNSYDFIRLRELQCFCLKESFMKAKLGVGVPSIVEGVRAPSNPNSISSRNKCSETMG